MDGEGLTVEPGSIAPGNLFDAVINNLQFHSLVLFCKRIIAFHLPLGCSMCQAGVSRQVSSDDLPRGTIGAIKWRNLLKANDS
jgi:hypothetical protein